MEALILATGARTIWHDHLVEIGGKPLLLHHLDAVSSLSPTRITAVVGPDERDAAAAIGERARLVVSDAEKSRSSLRSLLTADPGNGGLLVVSGDVLVPALVLRRLTRHAATSTLAYDSSGAWDEAHVKIRKRRDRLARITHDIPLALSSGVYAGAVYLTPADAAEVFRASAELAGEPTLLDWTSALNLVAQDRRILCVDVAGTPWSWVETNDELAAAEATVWPAIAALAPSSSHGWRAWR